MPTARLPMKNRPRIVNCGFAEHGIHGHETWALPRLWCLHLYFYDVELVANRHVLPVVSGSLTLIPPGVKLVYHYEAKRHRHFYVIFGARPGAPYVTVPLLQHVPDARDEILDRLQNIQRLLTTNQMHAETLLWGLLWDIAEAGRRGRDVKPAEALLERIETFVEKSLPRKISVHDVATHVGLSPTHVNRVIKSALGQTTVQFIKKRRLQRAYRLLIHSTMPVKLIASECGIEDLQQFNKLMRSWYGKSPRELRAPLPGNAETTWALDRE